MIQKYLIQAGLFALSLVLAFFAGTQYNKANEAEKTTVAVIEKVEKVAETQGALIEIGLEHADKEIDIKVQNRMIEEEVNRRVKELTINVTCITPDGVRSISKALGYSGSEDNSKPD